MLNQAFKATVSVRFHCDAAMVAKVWGNIWYFDIPSPNSIVFSVLWPTSIALWGSLVLPYMLLVK